MTLPREWKEQAFNPDPASENEIHGDAVARRFGFRGGLVPGVTVSAYLIHPAAEAWGIEWLERGRAHVVVKSPVYDGSPFTVTVDDDRPTAWRTRLRDDRDVLCAEAEVDLPSERPDPPRRRGDPLVEKGFERPRASREVFERLRETGMHAVRARFGPGAEITTYLRDPEAMAPPFRPSGPGLANPAFVLGMTNWALAANVRLSPWLHLETTHQNFAAIAPGTELVVELSVTDLFERKGHEFVDADIAAFRLDGAAVLQCRLRAIYKLRGA